MKNKQTNKTNLPNVDSWVEASTNIHHYVCAKNLMELIKHSKMPDTSFN